MKSVHIREIRPDVLDALKRLARMNNRSLQGELRDILEKASRRVPSTEGDDEPALVTVKTGSRSPLHRGELYGDSGR